MLFWVGVMLHMRFMMLFLCLRNEVVVYCSVYAYSLIVSGCAVLTWNECTYMLSRVQSMLCCNRKENDNDVVRTSRLGGGEVTFTTFIIHNL